MEFLSEELAQSIVERTMNVVSYNINIMNEQGIIIASGDKERIGTIHEGAIIALQRKSEFNVNENQSKELNGVHPGTNTVIEFQNKVVGVIGITGKPKEVLRYGKLIKMTAEMMIEQAQVLKELEWNNRIKEEMILALIHNQQKSFPLLDEYTKKFNIPYNHPMAIIIVEIDVKAVSERNDLDVIKKMVTVIEGILREALVAIIDSKTIIILYKCMHKYNKDIDCKEKATEIYTKLNSKVGIYVQISVGKIYENLFDMHKSFKIAKETLIFGKKMHPKDNIYIFDLLKYEMLLSQENADWKMNELKNTYEKIASKDKNGELRETLKIFIEENGELNNISNRLFIHRNTLTYRLNNIYKLTNMNPKKYTDLFWLYCVMVNFNSK